MTETLHPAEPQDVGLFVTDIELARRLGISPKIASRALRRLEDDPRFPKRDALFANKRFWPAVEAYLFARYGLKVAAPAEPDGEENFSDFTSTNRRRARPELAPAG